MTGTEQVCDKTGVHMSDSEDNLALSVSGLAAHDCKEGDEECQANVDATSAKADAGVNSTSHASASKSPHVEESG